MSGRSATFLDAAPQFASHLGVGDPRHVAHAERDAALAWLRGGTP